MRNKRLTFQNMRLKKRFLRLILPIFVLNISVLVIDSVFPLNITYTYLMGLFPLFQGPGTYYLLLVIEGTLLLPVLLFLYRSLDNKYIFLLILFAANVIFEVFSFCIDLYMLSPLIYSGSIFRYILALGLGLYIYDNYHTFFQNNFIKFLILLSFVYLLGWGIFQYSVPYFTPITKWQNVFSFMYSAFIVFILLQKLEAVKTYSSVFINFFIITGKASWHIFLFQIIYFSVGINMLLFKAIERKLQFSFYLAGGVTILVSLLFIIVIGIYWYKVELYIIERYKI